MIICRSEMPLNRELKDKISRSCGVDKNCVIESFDCQSIYQIPILFMQQDILEPISQMLNLGELKVDMSEWNSLVKRVIAPSDVVRIAFVGKYIELKESYKSLTEALVHAGAHLDTKVDIMWCDSEKIYAENVSEVLKNADGVLVAGGFGKRGVEGKIESIKYARINQIPYLGICLGKQLSLIEFAKNVLNLKDANSVEFDEKSVQPVVYLIDEFIGSDGSKQVRTYKSPLGGTMRLGGYDCKLKDGTLLKKLYGGVKSIRERHRHRFEVNPKYKEQFEKAGLVVSGECDGLIEAVELKGHPFFIGVQFHPEFTSRLTRPNPAILGFINAANSR